MTELEKQYKGKNAKVVKNLGEKKWNWLVGHNVKVLREDNICEGELRCMITDISVGFVAHEQVMNFKPEELEVENVAY